MYQLITSYRDNNALRASFNSLALETFGLNFEDWYQNGFWSDNYNPYSIVRDNTVIANVSVNKTDMLLDGKVKHFLQLGTVMTKEAFRNKGLIREIMKRIDTDFSGKCDGIYLFANDSVLSFYPKFGFEKSAEYQYHRKISSTAQNTAPNQFEKVIMDNPGAWKMLLDAMNTNVFHGRFDMANNNGLIMFYVTKFMQENVFFHKESDTYVIADKEDDSLLIHAIFSKTIQDAETVISLFGETVNEVSLGFAPMDTDGWQVTPYHEDDCTFFIKGTDLAVIEKEKLRIPSLAHA